jgi:hypothetical protein
VTQLARTPAGAGRADSFLRLVESVVSRLPVCDRIVRALGGRMWAAKRDGGGAEFGFAPAACARGDRLAEGPKLCPRRA